MEKLRERLFQGMKERGIVGEIADTIFRKMEAFASYGFPESHSVSFAYLVYASAYIKYHEPAIFCAALLNAQPMGFWSPHSLARDARRHGVEVFTPCINASQASASLVESASSTSGLAVRMGLSAVRGVSSSLAQKIEEAQPFDTMEHVVRAVPELSTAHLEAFATAGAFDVFGTQRRNALWAAGAVAQSRPTRLEGITVGNTAPALPGMEPIEEAVADLWATGVSPDGHPTIFLREKLHAMGVLTASELAAVESGTRIYVAGVVTHRQRPRTASGVTFMNLEDETGLINVVCSPGCWTRFRTDARGAAALLVRGRVESSEGVVNIIAEHLSALRVAVGAASRDFR